MPRKLAVFDIDGTIAVRGAIPEAATTGISHLHARGFLTTVCTGRSYRRLRDALGRAFETVISPEALITIEHGTKIVHRDGSVVHPDYFTNTEKDHFVDFVRANEDMVTFCMHALPDPKQQLELWAKNPEEVEALQQKRGAYARVFHSSYEELKHRLRRHEVSHTLAKLQDFVTAENLRVRFTRSNMNVHFMDGSMQFVGSFTDKAKAILFLEQFHKVRVADMLIAGNGINDADMLNLPAGKRILVGPDELATPILGYLRDKAAVVRVQSPEELGIFLHTLD